MSVAFWLYYKYLISEKNTKMPYKFATFCQNAQKSTTFAKSSLLYSEYYFCIIVWTNSCTLEEQSHSGCTKPTKTLA